MDFCSKQPFQLPPFSINNVPHLLALPLVLPQWVAILLSLNKPILLVKRSTLAWPLDPRLLGWRAQAAGGPVCVGRVLSGYRGPAERHACSGTLVLGQNLEVKSRIKFGHSLHVTSQSRGPLVGLVGQCHLSGLWGTCVRDPMTLSWTLGTLRPLFVSLVYM